MGKGKINIIGIIGEDATALDVIRDVKALGEVDEITVNINSVGGSIEEGFSIYSFLKNHKAKIVTVGRGSVNSIATVIFQAGNERILSNNVDFVIHNANIDPSVLGISVDANILQGVTDYLRGEEDRITDFYSNITSIDFQTLSNLMDKETNLTAEQAVNLGFADKTFNDLQAVAKHIITNMNTTNKKNSNKLLNAFDVLKEAVLGVTGFGTRNSVEVTTEDGAKFYIDMTGEDMTGHRITTMQDGKPTETPAPDGEHRLTSGKLLTVSGGEITSVRDTTEIQNAGHEEETEKGNEETQHNEDQMEKEEFAKIAAEAGAEAGRSVVEELMAKMDEKELALDAKIEAFNKIQATATETNTQAAKTLTEALEGLKEHTTSLKLPKGNPDKGKELTGIEKMRKVTDQVNNAKQKTA